MKVTFVYQELEYAPNWKGTFHFGIAWISATLREAGHETSLVHLNKVASEEEFVALLEHHMPFSLLAFSSTTNEFCHVKLLAAWAKKQFGVPIICGGVHATVDPEDAISAQAVDMICVGEGEQVMVELCDKLDSGADISTTGSLCLKRGDEIIRNPVRPLIEDLNVLPFPDREIFDYENLEEMAERRLVILASRGCPYNCAHCCNHVMRQRYPNKAGYYRCRSVDNVIAEIEQGLKRYPAIERVVFHDDCLNIDKEWFVSFLEQYSKRVGLPFACNSRANLVDSSVAQRLRRAGCTRISIGVESGNDFIRNQVLNRNMARQEIVTAFDACKSVGIRTLSYNMVGMPFEDMSATLDTIKLNAMIKPSEIQTSIVYPYPNTDLFNLCVEHSFIEQGKIIDNYFEDTILKLDTITRQQIIFARTHFDLLVALYSLIKKLPSPIGQVVTRVTDKMLCSSLFPYNFLTLLRHLLSLRHLLRARVPRIYGLIRRYYKRKVQYRR